MKENDVAYISEQFGIEKDVVSASIEDGTLSQRIKDSLEKKVIYPKEDFEKFKTNLTTEAKDNYYNELIEAAKKGEAPADLYKPIKGAALQQLERELSKELNVSEFTDVKDLVQKAIKLNSSASGKPNDELLGQIEQLKTVNLQLQKEKDEAVQSVTSKFKQRTIEDKKAELINSVPFDLSDVKAEEVESAKEKRVTILKSVFNEKFELDLLETGQIVVKDKEGNVIKNSATLDPVPVKDVFLSLAKDFGMKLTSPDPGGQGGQSSGQSTGTYNSVAEFEADMKARGIATTDPKYYEEYAKTGLGNKK